MAPFKPRKAKKADGTTGGVNKEYNVQGEDPNVVAWVILRLHELIEPDDDKDVEGQEEGEESQEAAMASEVAEMEGVMVKQLGEMTAHKQQDAMFMLTKVRAVLCDLSC